MKRLLFFLFAVTTITVSAQTRQSLLSAALKNSNASDTAFLMRDSVLAHIYYDAESDSMLLADLKKQKLITQEDVVYMSAQLKGYKPHTWTADSIPNAQIVPSSKTPPPAISFKKSVKIWSAYFKTYKSGYYDVSEPIFSKDGTMAIVYVSFQCGASCGNGGATLYKFEKGVWKPVKNLFSWEK
ncbi:MAG: hypothetical protein M3R17_20445 [Bacteroidota bacterium]|nr:hypothetical protein [Bacteroidota bacterium]